MTRKFAARQGARRVALGASLLIGAAAVTAFAPFGAEPAAAATPSVTLAVPAYFNDQALWDKVVNAAQVTYVIGHPETPVPGRAYTPDKTLADRLANAKAKGKTTLVYVTAGYDKVDWQVVAEKIDIVLSAYPSADGVFIDEINYDQCDKYKLLTGGTASIRGVRARQPSKLVVLNPGAPMLNCYEGLADGYVNLERAQRDVPAWVTNINEPGNVPFYRWMFRAENRPKMWQMVHSVPAGDITASVDAALTRNASVLYITPDALPNPYDSLPDDATWQRLLERVDSYAKGTTALPPVTALRATSSSQASTKAGTTKTGPKGKTKVVKKVRRPVRK